MVECIIAGSLCTLGVYASMGDGMILHWLEIWLSRISDNRLMRPLRPALYECPICMASIWGTGFWLIMGMPVMWLIYVFAVAGFNYIVVNITDE